MSSLGNLRLTLQQRWIMGLFSAKLATRPSQTEIGQQQKLRAAGYGKAPFEPYLLLSQNGEEGIPREAQHERMEWKGGPG